MTDATPARHDSESLADVVEMLLDKGVVINADIAVSVGDTELLAIQIRAALASFETAAEYGLEFPDGTDMQRVAEASGRSSVMDRDATPGMGDDATTGGHAPAVTAADAGDDDEDAEETDSADDSSDVDDSDESEESEEAAAEAASTEGDDDDG